MNKDELQSRIQHLGKDDFDKTVELILARLFNMIPANVDGKGDGHKDIRLFKHTGEESTAACQITIQAVGWQAKAKADARGVVENYKATKYFFFTNHPRSALALSKLEEEITSELKIPAKCVGSTEIADFLINAKLLGELAKQLGLPWLINLNLRPEKFEICLHAYGVMSEDKNRLRTSVFDDTIFQVLYPDEAKSPNQIVDACMEQLQCPDSARETIARRIDNLRQTKKIEPSSQVAGALALSTEAKETLAFAIGEYLRELALLHDSQVALFAAHKKEWSQPDTEKAAIYIPRHFIKRSIEVLNTAKAQYAITGLFRNLGDPEQELRDHLSRKVGDPSLREELLEKLVNQARDLPVIRKLVRAALYVALEGNDPLLSAKSIGAASWDQVTLLLDASVAIPYLCTQLFGVSKGRFSKETNSVIEFVRTNKGRTLTTKAYTDECVGHLISAFRYCELGAFENELKYSRNGYVAHYFYRKEADASSVPATLREFLETISRNLRFVAGAAARSSPGIYADIQRHLTDFGILLDDTRDLDPARRRQIEEDYSYKMNAYGIKKSDWLIKHDVEALATNQRAVTERGEHRIFLTWDRTLIDLGSQRSDCGWVISPNVICDLIQAYRPLTDAQLSRVYHAIGKARPKPDEVTAQILDRIVSYCQSESTNWKFARDIPAFRDEMIARIDKGDANYTPWLDQEIKQFLVKQGVEVGPKGNPSDAPPPQTESGGRTADSS